MAKQIALQQNSAMREADAPAEEKSRLRDKKNNLYTDEIPLLYTCRDYVVCVKPVGPDAEHDLPEALQKQLGGEIYTLHRLDVNVGGVMVYARTSQAAAAFSRMIQNGEMKKEYVALVHGEPEASGDWQDLLWKDSRKNKVFVVDRERKGVKPARLEYRKLRTMDINDVGQSVPGQKTIAASSQERVSLVRIRLHTGRSHQIRVQFASRKYPLLGDHKYGARDGFTAPMLYSCCIAFLFKGKQQQFECMPAWAEKEDG